MLILFRAIFCSTTPGLYDELRLPWEGDLVTTVLSSLDFIFTSDFDQGCI